MDEETENPDFAYIAAALTERSLLEEIYISQKNVEKMVSAAFEQIGPMLEKVKSRGIMGLLG